MNVPLRAAVIVATRSNSCVNQAPLPTGVTIAILVVLAILVFWVFRK